MSSSKDKPLSFVLTGGGSGGHITPVLAVAHELHAQRPGCHIAYIGQKGDSLADIPAQDPDIDQAYVVRAGKLRRYHGEGVRQLFDLPTMAKNARDVVYVLIGIFQSWRLLRKLKPDAIFVKGGFVGVPVGLAAAWLRIPFVTHDSDALPGLANRIIARWAKVHAVALPKEVYNYPADKTVTVGVPISHRYQRLSSQASRQKIRQELGLGEYDQVVLVTGGGLGAQRLNQAVAAVVPELLQAYPRLVIVQQAGRNLEAALNQQYQEALSAEDRRRVQVKGYVNNLYDYSAVADVVVARAGGTTIAELSAQAKACIIVPNPILTGGHQLKNAQVLADKQAAELVSEKELQANPQALLKPLRQLLDNPERIKELGDNLYAMARPDAARSLAMVLLDVAD